MPGPFSDPAFQSPLPEVASSRVQSLGGFRNRRGDGERALRRALRLATPNANVPNAGNAFYELIARPESGGGRGGRHVDGSH